MMKIIINIWRFYYDGFRSMTIGKTLWLIMLIRLFIMLFILKLFFFPNYLKEIPSDQSKSEYVGNELIERSLNTNDE